MPAGQNNAAKTECPKGHEYTPENTLRHGSGKKRRCRACARANALIQNLKRYGLTPEKLREMLEEQDFACAICSRSFHEFTPHIDHDHKCCPSGTACGKCVRGLLCVDCNRGLGSFRDDPDLLHAAAVYLG
jgi:hypothetical protein